MQRTRQRQFHDVRQSHRESIKDNTSIISSVCQPLVKNTKGQACNTCINKIMSQFMRRKLKREKKKEQREEKKLLQGLMNIGNPQQQWKQKQQKQALNYNKSLIDQHKNAFKKEKTQEQKIRQYLQNTDVKLQKQMKEMFKKDKERNKKYRQELFQQMQQEKKRKKQQLLKEKQVLIVPSFQLSKSYDEVQYRNFLKNQIKQKEKAKKQLKTQQILKDKQQIQIYQTQAKLYHTPQKLYNPEVFIQLKKLQKSKKDTTINERLQKQRQRKKEERIATQAKDQFLKSKFKNMLDYANELNHQMSQKRQRLSKSKKQLEKYINPYEEDQFTKSRKYKHCEQCDQTVPAEYISKIPELI